MSVRYETTVPRTVRVVPPVALFAIALRAIPRAIDTLIISTVHLDRSQSVLLGESSQVCYFTNMLTHVEHHPSPWARHPLRLRRGRTLHGAV